MFTLILENEYHDRMELTHNINYDIVSADGFDPPDAVICTTSGARTDGSIFNSSRLENRTITLTIAINYPAEENRLTLYRFFSPKRYVKMRHITETRDVYTEGHVQNVTVDMFAQKQIAQVTVICSNPYLVNTEDAITNFSYVESLFEFPFSIDSAGEAFSELHTVQEEIAINNGEVETGAIIEMHARGAVTNPSITYADTGEKIALALTLSAGDTVTINTREKQKSITLTHNGVTSSVVGYMSADSVFFQLRPGECALVVDASSGATNIDTTVIVEGHFTGV